MKITMAYEWPLFKPFPGHVPLLVHVERDPEQCPACLDGKLRYSIKDDLYHCNACTHTADSV